MSSNGHNLGLDVGHHTSLPKLVDRFGQWYRDKMKHSLILAGNPGCGKSHIAYRLSKLVKSRYLIQEPEFFRRIENKPLELREIINQIKSCDLVIYDDLGVGRPQFVKNDYEAQADWRDSVYWQLLNYSPESKPSVFIITTNLSLVNLGEWIGESNESIARNAR